MRFTVSCLRTQTDTYVVQNPRPHDSESDTLQLDHIAPMLLHLTICRIWCVCKDSVKDLY